MIKRIAEDELRVLASQFRAVAVVGPRQSGKTTLVRSVFPEKAYANLENPDLRRFATEDPRGFLATFRNGAILDEIQRVPLLFSYLQQILDETNENGKFILSGSNNFLIQDNISQSLAGRVGYLFLLPLSMQESENNRTDINDVIFKGGYPALYNDDKIDTGRYYSNYIITYIERDVRQLKNISDLFLFEKFIRLCAGRIGSLLNMSNLALETGVDVKTVSSWLGVLEASFVLFLLRPWHENFNKRVVKMPKLYFYDTGLAAALLGIEDVGNLPINPWRGNLFENLVILEFIKNRFNHGKKSNLYFWRDNTGNEIDLVSVRNAVKMAVEIKSGQTVTEEFFKGINYWNKITGSTGGLVIYSGNNPQNRSNGVRVVPVSQLGEVLSQDIL